MASTYVPISRDQMNKMIIGEMGFAGVDYNAGELVYERQVSTAKGTVFPYTVRVFSSIKKDTGWSDDVGADAIRVVVIDNLTGRPAKKSEKRVHRTKNALPNMRQRCRDAFKFVIEAPHCPKCNAIMVERQNTKTKSRFLACSRFAPGKPHHCDGTKTVAQGDTV